jgi:N-acyl-D-aspartate/D-glutamate deacylase
LVDFSAIAVESLLVACKENQSVEAFARVSDLAQIATELLKRRGGEASAELGGFGKRLKSLGFTTERDAEGKKLRLTEAARKHIQQLALNLGLAGSGNGAPDAKA